jgi:hypothetical protein
LAEIMKEESMAKQRTKAKPVVMPTAPVALGPWSKVNVVAAGPLAQTNEVVDDFWQTTAAPAVPTPAQPSIADMNFPALPGAGRAKKAGDDHKATKPPAAAPAAAKPKAATPTKKPASPTPAAAAPKSPASPAAAAPGGRKNRGQKVDAAALGITFTTTTPAPLAE